MGTLILREKEKEREKKLPVLELIRIYFFNFFGLSLLARRKRMVEMGDDCECGAIGMSLGGALWAVLVPSSVSFFLSQYVSYHIFVR